MQRKQYIKPIAGEKPLSFFLICQSAYGDVDDTTLGDGESDEDDGNLKARSREAFGIEWDF